MLVAVIGVAVPFAAGAAAGVGLGWETDTAIFLGAALTATSVGITARVFGDLHALATTEARIVLGAAVADDVLGLIILTVVVKVVTGDSVRVGVVASTVLAAVVFLVVAGLVGILAVPPTLGVIARGTRSGSTLTVAALVIVLGLAVLADAAQLAFIIGAFMAGLAIGRSDHQERIARDLNSVGGVLIPVFFVLIGVNADLEAMLAAERAAGCRCAAGDRHRRQARVGVRRGRHAGRPRAGRHRDDPPWRGRADLREHRPRPGRARRRAVRCAAPRRPGHDDRDAAPVAAGGSRQRRGSTSNAATSAKSEPADRWVTVHDGVIRLAADPPSSALVPVAIQTAALCWRGSARATICCRGSPTGATSSSRGPRTDTDALLGVLPRGNPRAVRFLDVTGVLERGLPTVAGAVARRRADPSELDPARVLRFPVVARLGELLVDSGPSLPARDRIREATCSPPWCSTCSGRTPSRRRYACCSTSSVSTTPPRSSTCSHRPPSCAPAPATSTGTASPSCCSWRPTSARREPSRSPTSSPWPAVRRTPPRPAGRAARRWSPACSITPSCSARRDVDRRIAAPRRPQQLPTEPAAVARLGAAPASYLLAHDPEELARQARLVEPLPAPARSEWR